MWNKSHPTEHTFFWSDDSEFAFRAKGKVPRGRQAGCLAGPNADTAVDAASDSVVPADVAFGGSIIACHARILWTDETKPFAN